MRKGSRNSSRNSSMSFRILASVSALSLLLASVAAAQTVTPTPTASTPVPAKHEGLKARFDAMDANHDGFIDKGEASGRIARNFDAIDTDHDGKISLEELRTEAREVAANRKGITADAGASMTGTAPIASAAPEKHRGNLSAMDTDHDGRISFAEFTAREKALFDRLDTNHDGYLEASELPKGKQGNARKAKGSLGDNAFGTWGKPAAGGASSSSGQ